MPLSSVATELRPIGDPHRGPRTKTPWCSPIPSSSTAAGKNVTGGTESFAS